MRTFFICFAFTLLTVSSQAQDPGMQASQAATQAMQNAMDQAMRDNQQALQTQFTQSMLNQQQTMWPAPNTWPANCSPCGPAVPKFSVASGAYASTISVEIEDETPGTVIYYTTDGWIPTPASTRYTAPITIDSTTTLEAVAVSPRYGSRSRIVTADYTLNGVAPVPKAMMAAPQPASAILPLGVLVLARDTAVPLAFASDVTSKTADKGAHISLALAEDLRVGDVIVARKGAPAVATVTEVGKPEGLGGPGVVYFRVDYLEVGGARIKLRGSAGKLGRERAGGFARAFPVAGIFISGKDAEIKPGTLFNAAVDEDTPLPPAD